MTASEPAERAVLLRRCRRVLGLFILALLVSGLTAFPLKRETELLAAFRGLPPTSALEPRNGFDRWILAVRDGLQDSYAQFPWLAYGTDWLAFAHIVIAMFFIGPLVDPVRNVWVLRAGMIACVLVVPLALVCGAIRGIPFGWRLIDCSFGVFGAAPLYYCFRLTRRLERNGAT